MKAKNEKRLRRARVWAYVYARVRSAGGLHPRVNGVSGKRGEGGSERGELSAESWGVSKKHSLATSFSKKDFVLVLRGKWEKAKFAGRKTPKHL